METFLLYSHEEANMAITNPESYPDLWNAELGLVDQVIAQLLEGDRFCHAQTEVSLRTTNLVLLLIRTARNHSLLPAGNTATVCQNDRLFGNPRRDHVRGRPTQHNHSCYWPRK
jgi:hypothetical protein